MCYGERLSTRGEAPASAAPMVNARADPDDLSNWMGEILSDDLPISAASLPGTHNSASFAIRPPRMAAIVAAGRCQSQDFSAQLRMGVRFLDLRVNPGGALCHGVISCGRLSLADALRVCSAFLRLHPREVIVARIKDEQGSPASAVAVAALVHTLSDICPLFLEARLPRLGEVRGHVVVLRDWVEPPSKIACGVGVLWGGTSMQIQDQYRHSNGNQKWHVVQQGLLRIAPTDSCLQVNFTSATSLPTRTPLRIARSVNPKLATYLRTTALNFVGIIAMDFPSASLCELVVRRNCCSLDPCRPLAGSMKPMRSLKSLHFFEALQSELILGCLQADQAAAKNALGESAERAEQASSVGDCCRQLERRELQAQVQRLSRLLVSLATERARVEHEESSIEDGRDHPAPLIPPLLSRSASPPLSPAGSPLAPVRHPGASPGPSPLVSPRACLQFGSSSDSAALPIVEAAILLCPEPDAKLCMLTKACNAAVQRPAELGRLRRFGAGFFGRCART